MEPEKPSPEQLNVLFWTYLVIAFFMSMGMTRSLHANEDILATLFGFGSFVFSFATVATYAQLKPEKK